MDTTSREDIERLVRIARKKREKREKKERENVLVQGRAPELKLEKKISHFSEFKKNKNMQIAIHTVFILRENILFLEEWIDYHLLLGFNKFYLYDNSKVNKIVGWDLKHSDYLVHGKVNKYKINYSNLVDMTDTQMNDYVQQLCDKYKCIEITEWSPKDETGTHILHNQYEAHNHCLKKLKTDRIDWCVNLDMDEYIVLGKFWNSIGDYLNSLRDNINNVCLDQILFETRFHHIDKRVIDITSCKPKESRIKNAHKNLYKVKKTRHLSVHKWFSKQIDNSIQINPEIEEICFNHYKLNDPQDGKIDNINPNIKTQLKKNAESYIFELISKKQ